MPHSTTSYTFGALLIANFIAWYYFERNLSIHSIYTWRREAFYWLTVLWTFVLGTATGDWASEDGQLGYWRTLVIVLSILIADYMIFLAADRFLKPCPRWVGVTAFWVAYILTRPLGASIGDLLTAKRYPEYDPANCNPIGTSSDDVGCSDPDVFCITNCANFKNCTDVTLTCP